jgi:hypothetical protein
MDFSSYPKARDEHQSFVEWEGRWYGVPNTLAHNMRKAGLTVRKMPQGAAQSGSVSRQNNDNED